MITMTATMTTTNNHHEKCAFFFFLLSLRKAASTNFQLISVSLVALLRGVIGAPRDGCVACRPLWNFLFYSLVCAHARAR